MDHDSSIEFGSYRFMVSPPGRWQRTPWYLFWRKPWYRDTWYLSHDDFCVDREYVDHDYFLTH